MRDNRMKRILQAGKPAIGTVVTLVDPFTAEIMAGFDFDFLLIDTEHTPITISELQSVMIALRPTDSTIIVRAAWNEAGLTPKPYGAGSWGPSAAIALTERDGVHWHD